MKTALSVLCVVFLLFITGSAMADEGHHHGDEAEGERALCPVCRVHEGETEAEIVVATAEHEGHSYGFCSEKCRDTFLEAPAGYVPPVFPRPAPAFKAHGLSGTEFSSEALKGKVVLLDFWATWCQPCVDDLPKLTRLHEQYEDDGLVVIGLSIDEGKRAARTVQRMMDRRDARHPVYIDAADTSAWASYQVRVVPSQFLIDADGHIVAQWTGKTDLDAVEAEITRVLGLDVN